MRSTRCLKMSILTWLSGMRLADFSSESPLQNIFTSRLCRNVKKGKHPRETVCVEYDLEYGKACMEIHKDTIKPGARVLVVDDLLATGGTAKAAATLIEKLGGKVEFFAFVIELLDLHGHEALKGYRVESLTKFPGH